MLDLEKIKSQIENGELDYAQFVELVNSDSELSLEEFCELMTDDLAKELDISDFPILEAFVETVEMNIEKRFNTSSYVDYEYQPKEDGGIYTRQIVLTNPELGIIGEFMEIETCAGIRIDFRPEVGMYVEVVFINETDKTWLMGECKYLHFEIDIEGNLSEPSLESM